MARGEFTVLGAFSGLGGLDLGLEAAGFCSVGCIEIDEVARRSLKANRDAAWPVLEPGDISEVARQLHPEHLGLSFGELDLLAGAPPCQPFSKAGQWEPRSRAGARDRRGRLLFDFMNLAEAFAPRAVIIENVQGFVSGPTSVTHLLEDALADLEAGTGFRYSMTASVVDAYDHGVPQKRRRAIIVLLRDGKDYTPPVPISSKERPTAWDAIRGLPEPPEGYAQMTGKWADLLPSIPEGENYLWHAERDGGVRGEPLFGYRTRYWSFLLKLARDLPSWTLAAQPGPSTGPFHWDNRPLTISEMLRLQSFPADWVVEGNRRERVVQVGNATPPLLAEVLGWSLRAALDGDHVPPHAEMVHAIRRRRRVPPRSKPAAVHPKYVALTREHHAPHPGAGKGPRPRQP